MDLVRDLSRKRHRATPCSFRTSATPTSAGQVVGVSAGGVVSVGVDVLADTVTWNVVVDVLPAVSVTVTFTV